MSAAPAAAAAAAAGAAAPAAASTPADFLRSIRGKPVVVRLNSGADYRGVLACLDGYMNVALEQTEEYVGGQLKNAYGDAFLRGNNVLYIAMADAGGGVGGGGGGSK
jgi:U6 snRNA-associated Sm-like protein LSm6